MENRKGWKPIVLSGGLMAILIAGAGIFGWREQPVEMGIMVVACSICLAFANIDRIQSFKGAGFQAEMRKAVDEAYATTEHLKAIAAPLVLAGMQNLTYRGSWEGLGRTREQAIKREFEQAAKLLDLDQPELKATFKAFYVHRGIDLITDIYNEVKDRFPNQAVYSAIDPLLKRDAQHLPTIDQLLNVLSPLSPEQKEILSPHIVMYEHYLANESSPS